MLPHGLALVGRVAAAEEVARSASERLDKAAMVVGEMCSARPEVTGRRLKSVEGKLRPDAYITDEQAAEINLRVKAPARLMGSESAQYQSVLSELVRRFGVARASFYLLNILRI